MSMHRFVVAAITTAAIITPALAREAPLPDDAWWLEIQVKARSILIDPAAATQHEVMDDDPMSIHSPDGKRIAYIASDPQRVKDGHNFDLFVADIDASQPSGKSHIRRLTNDQEQPADPQWLSDSSGIVFQAGDNPSFQVWYIDLGPESRPVRLSDGQHRCYDVSITSDARVAWIVHKGSKNKQQFKDLALHPSLMAKGHMQTLLVDQHISSYAISPDGKTLAWSGLGSMFLVNLETDESREIPLHGIHRQLLNHTAHEIAWRPDGKIIAIRCGFLGGIARELGADPNEPWPRMFAADKVFFIPAEWAPTAESLTVGTTQEGFPSPMANDPQAEISPPAGDESKPWWLRELPERVLNVRWTSATDARQRIATRPAPPEERVAEPQRMMPPVPRQSIKQE